MSDNHLGLDALAEATAHPPDGRSAVARHLVGCAGCTARLAELRAAEPSVTAALAAMPVPPIPPDVAARLDDALAALPAVEPAADPAPEPLIAPVTTLPTSTSTGHRTRWLAAAAGVVVLLAGVGVGVGVLHREDSRGTTSAAGAPGAAPPVRNDTGNDYADRATLAAAIPGLLAGTAPDAGQLRAAPAPAAAPKQDAGQSPESGGAAADTMSAQVADPLARLRSDPGLADCLRALLPPDDPSVHPLALDYGSYRGTPAMVVVLPGVARGKLDVYVVGSGCSPTNDSTLFYASVPAP